MMEFEATGSIGCFPLDETNPHGKSLYVFSEVSLRIPSEIISSLGGYTVRIKYCLRTSQNMLGDCECSF